MVLAATGGGTAAATTTATEPPIEGTHWVIEAVTDGSGTAPIPATPEAYIELSGGWLDGFTGCNWVSGEAEVGAGTVTLAGMGYTKRGCSTYPEWLEYRMQWVLADGDLSAVVADGVLTLTRPEGRSLTLRAAP